MAHRDPSQSFDLQVEESSSDYEESISEEYEGATHPRDVPQHGQPRPHHSPDQENDEEYIPRFVAGSLVVWLRDMSLGQGQVQRVLEEDEVVVRFRTGEAAYTDHVIHEEELIGPMEPNMPVAGVELSSRPSQRQ